MRGDQRKGNSRYYDLGPDSPDDLPFYEAQIPSGAAVLELGCGTGRILIPLAKRGGSIYGIDYSQDMIESCRAKLPDAWSR